MNDNDHSDNPAERLRRSSFRYRVGRSAVRFFAQWVRLTSPGAVVVLTAFFLSKILYPPLQHTLYALPLWMGATTVYLLFHRDRWVVQRTRADALADLQSGANGLFMALRASEDPEWRKALRAEPPRLRPGLPTGSVLMFLALTGCAIGILLLPDLRPREPVRRPSATPVPQTEELIEVMEEAQMAEEDYLKEAEKLVSELRQNRPDGLDPEDWRALDSCREELKRQAAHKLRRQVEARRELRATTRAMQAGHQLRDEDRQRMAKAIENLPQKELNGMLEKLGQRTNISAKQLREMLEQCSGGNCSLPPEQEKAMAALAQEMSEGEAGLEPGQKKALLASGFSEKELRQMLNQMPGRGGVERGPGPAPLRQVGQTPEEGAKFSAKTFEGNQGEADASLGFALSAPDEEDDTGTGEVVRGEGRRFEAGGGEITWHARLLPRHSEVLKEYFGEQEDREAK